MTKMAKKISEEIMSYIEITYPFMFDSILKEEREDILSTAESLIDSEIMIEVENGIKKAIEVINNE